MPQRPKPPMPIDPLAALSAIATGTAIRGRRCARLRAKLVRRGLVYEYRERWTRAYHVGLTPAGLAALAARGAQ